jgi:chromosome partitioning protein
MTRILAIVNQKGGVGKTTTAVNLATALAAIDQRVLLLDLDPQGNASTGVGVPPSERTVTTYDILLGDKRLHEAARETAIPRLSIIPATIDLSAAEIELSTMEQREHQLKKALEQSELSYDYILIDCPPSLGLVTVNALVAAQSIFIPLQCEFYALEGLSHLLKTIKLVQRQLNKELDILGVVLTMYDRRNKLTLHIEDDVRAFLGDTVFRTVIPRNVRMSEAPSFGQPALIYDMQCSGSRAYLELAKEMIKREAARATARSAA